MRPLRHQSTSLLDICFREERISNKAEGDRRNVSRLREPLGYLVSPRRPFIGAPKGPVDALAGSDRRMGTGAERPTKQLHRADAPHDPIAPEIEIGLRGIVAGDALAMGEVVLVVASIAHEGEGVGEGLSSSTGAPDTLLVIEALRWDVGHHDRAQRANVDADLHRRRHAQHVDGRRQLVLLGRRQERAAEVALALALKGEGLGRPVSSRTRSRRGGKEASHP